MIVPQVDLFSVFLEELKTPKSPVENDWPLGSCDQKKIRIRYGITYCITSKKIMHKKYVIMCWRVRKRRNSTGSECSVRFPSGKHTMTSMCLVLVILTYYSAFYLLPTYLEHTYVHSQAYSQQSSEYRYHTPMFYVGNTYLGCAPLDQGTFCHFCFVIGFFLWYEFVKNIWLNSEVVKLQGC